MRSVQWTILGALMTSRAVLNAHHSLDGRELATALGSRPELEVDGEAEIARTLRLTEDRAGTQTS